MNKLYFISYSPPLGAFVKVRTLTEPEVSDIIVELQNKTKSIRWKLEDYVKYIVNKVIIDVSSYTSLLSVEDGLYEALFSNVIEIHPMFSVDNVCDLVNSETAKTIVEDPEEQEITVRAKNKKKKKTLDSSFESIKTRVIGQDKALDKIHNLLKLKESGMESFVSMFFIGPTGVGKTETAKLLSELYMGDKAKLVKINCAELGAQHEYSRLIGSPPGYVGSSEKSLLLQKSEESSEWLFLFDEFEKAHPKLQEFLLGLLDDGSIMDNHGRPLNFSKSVFIFTTNIGVREAYDKKVIGFGSTESSAKRNKIVIIDEFERSFSPEFRNRLNDVIFFEQLKKEDAKKIAKIQLKGIPVRKTDKLLTYIADESFSEKYGARNIKRFISKTIKLPIAERILSGNESDMYKVVFDGSSISRIE